VSDAERSTWLPCGIGVFIFCVCNTKLLQWKPLITRISSLDGNEIRLTSALFNDLPVP
jgi:hypothetical protein